jgi:hypothetical protein
MVLFSLGVAMFERSAEHESPQQKFDRMVLRRESFWQVVHEPFMNHDMTRADVRDLIVLGLQHSRGYYRTLAEKFGITPQEYKRFLSFLHRYDCHVDFRQFR